MPSFVFLLIWGLTTHGKFSVSGDEPHYLLVAESLWSDGDFDLADDYADGSSARFGHDHVAQDLHARPGVDGVVRSVHEPGLAVLILPVYVAARGLAAALPEAQLRRVRMSRGLFTYAIVSLFQTAITCLALGLVLDTARHRSTPGIAILVTAAVGLAPPVLSNAFLVFPEVPALLIVAFVLWTCWGTGAERWWTPVAAAAALGSLPWLHRKFTLLALALAFLVIWMRWRGTAWPRARTIAAALLCALPIAAFYACSLAWWGTLAGPTAIDRVPLSWPAFAVGAPGLLIDRENGLLVWAPIYLGIAAAWWHTRAWSWPLLVPVVALYLPSAAHDLWWGGFSPAARFLLPLIPCGACVLAGAMTNRTFARLFGGLCAIQLAISAIGWQWPRALWPRGDGHNRLLESIPAIGPAMSAALPDFRTGSAGPVTGGLWLLGLAVLSLLLVAAMRRSGDDAGRGDTPRA